MNQGGSLYLGLGFRGGAVGTDMSAGGLVGTSDGLEGGLCCCSELLGGATASGGGRQWPQRLLFAPGGCNLDQCPRTIPKQIDHTNEALRRFCFLGAFFMYKSRRDGDEMDGGA